MVFISDMTCDQISDDMTCKHICDHNLWPYLMLVWFYRLKYDMQPDLLWYDMQLYLQPYLIWYDMLPYLQWHEMQPSLQPYLMLWMIVIHPPVKCAVGSFGGLTDIWPLSHQIEIRLTKKVVKGRYNRWLDR